MAAVAARPLASTQGLGDGDLVSLHSEAEEMNFVKMELAADRGSRRGRGRVVTEAYPESEFNLNPSSGNANGKSAITVEDLMTPLQDTAGFGTIRKRMEQLQNRGAPLEAPLPKVVQDRLNRKAAYHKTSDDITRWQPTVKRNREAPRLVFNKPEPAPSLSTASLAASFKPTTDLEKEIRSLLRESNVAEGQDVEAAEALELNKLTVEEVRQRQERLAKMRNLLFRHEAKAKRMKKIKSKAYHRLLQKDHKPKAEVDAAVDAAVDVADPEASKAAAVKREFNRARERMTLKHKNSSRWAKRILKRGLKSSENDGTRDAIADQLRTHTALTRKIHSATLSDSDDASSESEEDTEDAVSGLVLEGTVKSKVLAKAKVATLKALQEGDEEDLPTSGLFSLPFMTRAIEKKKKAAQDDAMAILEQLEQAEEDGNILGLGEDVPRSQNGHVDEATTSGRVSFGEAKQANAWVRRKETAGDSDDGSSEDELEEELADKFGNAGVLPSKSSTPGKMNVLGTDRGVTKGFDAQHHQQTKLEQIDEIPQYGRTSYSGVTTVPAKRREVSIAGSQKRSAGNGVSVDLPKQTEKSDTASNGVSTHEAVTQSTFSDDDSDDDDDDDDDAQAGLLDASWSQQDLIRQAFAGDDVEAEFEKVKSQVLDEEVPVGEGPVSLPGWGQWTHVQKIKGQRAWLLKEQERVKSKRDNALSKRKDAHLKHAIISEKLDKKAAKYTAPSVPFPFTSREVFERSFRQPIGRDFNTDKAFRDMIRPAVIKSAGVIIDPITLDKSSVKRKETQATTTATAVAKRKRRS